MGYRGIDALELGERVIMAAKRIRVKLSDEYAVTTVPRKLVEQFIQTYQPKVKGQRNKGGSVTWIEPRTYGEAT